MPEECASMRSIARWVLPVLVGPRTAVTPTPRARTSRLEIAGYEWLMAGPGRSAQRRSRGYRSDESDPAAKPEAPRDGVRHKRAGGVALARVFANRGISPARLRNVYHDATECVLPLSLGTSPERIAAESLTRGISEFVLAIYGDAGWLAPQDAGGARMFRCFRTPQPLIPARTTRSRGSQPRRSPRKVAINRYIASQSYWVFASDGPVPARGAGAAIENCVACSTAGPIGVGTYMRNAASTRVPAIGAKEISMSRCSIKYWI